MLILSSLLSVLWLEEICMLVIILNSPVLHEKGYCNMLVIIYLLHCYNILTQWTTS